MSIDFHFSALWSWIQFVALTVLPIAFRELLHWLYEWQILLTGIMALIAARIWGRSVIRAARISARARNPALAETPAHPPKRTGATPVVVPVPLAAVPAPGTKAPIPLPRNSEMADRLFGLREQIRNTLSRMPCTDDVLTAERLAECRRISQYSLGEPPASASKLVAHRFDVLRSELAALGAVRETDTCRNAWEALVRINIDARDLMGPETAPTKAAAK